MSYLKIFIALSFLIFPVSLMSQNNVLDLRFEMNDDGKVTYSNFIYALNLGPFMLEVFHIRMPQADEYKETVFGAGYNVFAIGDIAIYGLGHYSIASDENYFEPAVFAIDVNGKLTGSLFLVYYVPLGDDGIRQWLIDPIEAQYNVWRSVSIGLSGYFWRPEGGSWFAKIGPKISITDKFGASELRISSVSDDGGTEFQLRRIVLF
jgi:hypothetical protein